MSFASELFSRVSLDAGGWGRAGKTELVLGRDVPIVVAGQTLGLRVDGRIGIELHASGGIDTWEVGRVDIDWPPPGVHTPGVTVPRPGAWPRVDARLQLDVQVRAQVADHAQKIFSALAPADAFRQSGEIGRLLGERLTRELERARDALLGAFPVSSFPFFDEIDAQPVKDAIARRLRDALFPDWARLATLVREQLAAALTGLRPELERLARAAVETMSAEFDRGVAMLHQLGRSWPELLGEVQRRIGDAVRAGASLAERGRWLVGEILERGGDRLVSALAELILALRDQWATRQGEAQVLLADAAAACRARGLDDDAVLAAVISSVTAAVSGQLARHAPMLGDLCEFAFGALGSWQRVAALLGDVLGRLVAGRLELGLVLTPIFATIRLRKSELYDLLRGLGNDELVKQVAAWLLARWDDVKRAFVDGLAEIKRGLELIAGLAEQIPAALRDEIEDLATLYHGALRLGKTLFQRPFGDARAWLPALRDTISAPGAAVLAEARRLGSSPLDAARSLATEHAASAWVGQVRAGLEQLFSTLWQKRPRSAEGAADQVADFSSWIDDFGRRLDRMVFQGGLVPLPFVVELGYHRLTAGQLGVAGAVVGLGEATIDKAKRDIEGFVGAPFLGDSAQLGFIEARARRGKLAIPDPTVMSVPSLVDAQVWDASFQIPLEVPEELRASVAIGYLPDLNVLDMRYMLPYGPAWSYKVADLDGDGFVREWEVAAVARAAGEGSKDPRHDCDRDGEVTAADVQLARDQMELYVNGLMYRRATAPIALRVALGEHLWATVAVLSCEAESIPGVLTRIGPLVVVEGCFDLLGTMTGGATRLQYPVRVHLELRDYVIDRLRAVELAGVPIFNLPTHRFDLVCRCGHEGRDLQLHLTSEPLNLLARQWTFQGMFFFKASLTGVVAGIVNEAGLGVAGKVDGSVSLIYECGAPLAQTIKDWHDRLVAAGEDAAALLASPQEFIWDRFRELLGGAKVFQLYRALKRLVGPFLDLLFDWTDPQADLRAALVYVRETCLRGYRPALTFIDLDGILRAWPSEPVGSAADAPAVTLELAAACAEAVRALELELGLPARGPAYLPGLLAERALAAIDARTAGMPATGELARIRVAGLFHGGRARFTAHWERLVPPDADTVSVPPAGEAQVRRLRLAWWGEVMPWDDATVTVTKPLYGSIVRFGAGALLFTAPIADAGTQLLELRENELGTIEGNGVLVRDAEWWLFVRCRGIFGWFRPAVALDDVTSTIGGRVALDPTKVNERPSDLLELRVSPQNTPDDIHFLRRAEEAVKLIGGGGELRDLIERERRALLDLLFEHVRDEVDRDDPDACAKVFAQLGHAERQAVWLQYAADMKFWFYLPKVLAELLPAIEAMVHGDFGTALAIVLGVMGRARDFDLEEALLAGDAAAPALRDAITLFVAIVVDARSAIDDLTGKRKENAEEKKWNDRFADLASKIAARGGREEYLVAFSMAVAQRLRLMLPSWLRGLLPGDEQWYEHARDDYLDVVYRGRCDDHGWNYERLKDLTDKQRRDEESAQDLWKEIYALERTRYSSDAAARATADAKRARYDNLSPAEKHGFIASELASSGNLSDPEAFAYTTEAFWGLFGPATRTTQVIGDKRIETTSVAIDGKKITAGEKSETTTQKNADGTESKQWATARAAQLDFSEGELTLGGFDMGQSKQKPEEPLRAGTLFSTKLGDDTITITYSFEGGGGVGAGIEVGAGTSAQATGAIRVHGYLLKVPLKLIFAGVDSLTVGLRFFLRFAMHLTDALDAAHEAITRDLTAPSFALIDARRLIPAVYAAIAMVQALRDVVSDHPDFIVKVLESVHASAQLDVLGSIHGGVSVTGEISEAVHVQASMKLATIVAPLLDLLDGGKAKIDQVALASERIIPEIKVRVSDETVLKGTWFPFGVRIQSRGTLASGSLTVPQGSSIRTRARDFWGWVAELVEVFRQRTLARPAPGEDDPRAFAKLRSVLLALDRGVSSLAAGGASEMWMSPDASVSELVHRLRGEPVQTAPLGTTGLLGQMFQAIKDAGVVGVALSPGSQALVARPGAEKGFMELSLHVTDEEKRRLDTHALSYPSPPTMAVENVVYRVPLPAVPKRVGWNRYVDPYDENRELEGLIVGFDDGQAAQAFADARDAAWVDGAVRTAWFPRDGKFWAWVDTTMVPALSSSRCPLPRVELEGGTLVLTFTATPLGATGESGAPILSHGHRAGEPQPIWELPLVKKATRGDFQLLCDQLAANAAARRS